MVAHKCVQECSTFFIIAKNWKQSLRLSFGEWINKKWCIHKMKSHLTIKSWSANICNIMNEPWKIMPNERRQCKRPHSLYLSESGGGEGYRIWVLMVMGVSYWHDKNILQLGNGDYCTTWSGSLPGIQPHMKPHMEPCIGLFSATVFPSCLFSLSFSQINK